MVQGEKYCDPEHMKKSPSNEAYFGKIEESFQYTTDYPKCPKWPKIENSYWKFGSRFFCVLLCGVDKWDDLYCIAKLEALHWVAFQREGKLPKMIRCIRKKKLLKKRENPSFKVWQQKKVCATFLKRDHQKIRVKFQV